MSPLDPETADRIAAGLGDVAAGFADEIGGAPTLAREQAAALPAEPRQFTSAVLEILRTGQIRLADVDAGNIRKLDPQGVIGPFDGVSTPRRSARIRAC